MGQRTKVEGTKIAQVAKDLNVTSVTIRRYLAEFNIKTATDENGIKVLPPFAMEELLEVRRLKEEGLSNPQVLEMLAGRRVLRKPNQVEDMEDENISDISNGTLRANAEINTAVKTEADNDTLLSPSDEGNPESTSELEGAESASDGRAKHSLTCQTCGKTFEHTNSRLRDCLECYRTKRKERRRGGDKHKNVIQHPIAAQVANKALQLQNARNGEEEISTEIMAEAAPGNGRSATDHSENRVAAPVNQAVPAMLRGPVRNYRKAIEETRQITGSLKRRLERPDLHEGERRWLEQIYAYQLILHQGWRHLSEYKSGGEPAKENLE